MLNDGNTQNLPSVYVDPTVELQSYFGRVGFNYLDKYLILGLLSGLMVPAVFVFNNRYGYFPSVSTRWAISNREEQQYFSNMALKGLHGVLL